MSQFFTSGGQSTEVSASASVLPVEYSGMISFRTDWFDLLAVQGTLKADTSVLSLLYGPTLPSVHDYWKNHSFD